jgi:hypothetical protein
MNAMLTDISLSGAEIRVSTAIPIGDRIDVRWFRENFSGTVRHCRAAGYEFVLGVQKDSFAAPEKVNGDASKNQTQSR